MAGEVHMAGRVQVAGKMGNAEYSWLGGMEECRMQAGEKNGGVQMAGESPDDWGMEECTWLEAWGECRWVGAWGSAAGLAAYVALDALETCVAAGDISRACVVDALASINLETTPLGLPISFGEGNQAEGGFSLFQIQDGKFVLLSGG